MENAICNELLRRGYNVDVGVVESTERNSDGVVEKKRREIDFVVVGGSQQLRLDDDGILYVGIVPFLMDTSILDSII